MGRFLGFAAFKPLPYTQRWGKLLIPALAQTLAACLMSSLL